MSDVELSSPAKALLRAARADAPSAAVRAKIWSGVGGAGAASGAAAAAGGASKLLLTGTLLGSALTVGLAAVLMHIGPATAPSSSPRALAPAAPHVLVAPAAAPALPATVTETFDPPAPVRAKSTTARPSPAAPGHADPGDQDPLMREASLVAEARGALLRGDAAGALRILAEAKALPARQLQPEELAIEERARRALGQGSR
jgi:hypothetical protein